MIRLGLAPIGAGDAHWTGQVGKYATWLPERLDNLADFVSLLRAGGCKSALWEPDGHRVVDNL